MTKRSLTRTVGWLAIAAFAQAAVAHAAPEIPPPVTAATSREATGPTDDALGRIRTALHDAMAHAAQQGFSGAFLVEFDGEILLADGYGDAGPGQPLTPTSLFSIGSVSKQFTAAAVMKLASEGKLDVGDTLAEHFSGVPDDKRAITIHQLLTHTAGFDREFSSDDYDPATRSEFVQRTLHGPLLFAPGSKHGYSNVGYMLLAALVEEVSGQPFETYLRTHLFEPAGLEHTAYVGTLPPSADVVIGYEGDLARRPTEEPIPPGSWFRRGAGGILSNVVDLNRWQHALRAGRVMPLDFVAPLFEPQMKEAEGDAHYGYGWVVATTGRGTRVARHDGAWYGFRAELNVYLDERASFVMLANRNEQVTETRNAIVRIIAGELSRRRSSPRPMRSR